jgi:hypothetical protein
MLAVAAASGCAGMSGQRFYEETKGKAGGLGDLIDCPTCPSASREAVVSAAHDDSVIPPHAKFHPVPTRPVFAPKVIPASIMVDAAEPAGVPTLAVAVDADEAPAPPTIAQRSSLRSVLKRSEPKKLPRDTTAVELTAPAPVEAPAAIPPKSIGDGWRPRVAN